MKPYSNLKKDELKKELDTLLTEYKNYQALNLNLNMTRGKPCIEQLNLSMGMMDVLNSSVDLTCRDGCLRKSGTV